MKETKRLPVLPLRGGVLFPGHVMPVLVEQPGAVNAVERALEVRGHLFAVALRDESKGPSAENVYSMGVVAKPGLINRGMKGLHLVLEGVHRAVAVRYHTEDESLSADAIEVDDMAPLDPEDPAFQALFAELHALARELGGMYGVPEEMQNKVLSPSAQPGLLADQIAGFLDISAGEKQQILELLGVEERMRRVVVQLQRKVNMMKTREQIKSKVQEELGERQRELYLREQLKAIRHELGEDGPEEKDLDDLRKRLAALDLPEEAREEVDRELERLERAGPGSAESQVMRTYLETMADLPWNKRSQESLEIARASEILDEDHFGLKEVKDRILEYLAVRKLQAGAGGQPQGVSTKGPILLFVGPPGVGKTSIAKSIARATGREYVRVSLGGVRDEADIRGHRRTYVGAMPGRIVQGLKRAGTKNPVFLLDEVDKLGVSLQGDPASALMEVLDPAQNDSFTDHYLNVPFDLSEVLFIATANYVQAIPAPLLDRMEAVEFSGYTEQEKREIARRYLIPRQCEETGLRAEQVRFGDGAVATVIGGYTRESGVRQLERELGRIARKVARQIAGGEAGEVAVDEEAVKRLLGRPKVRQERIGERNEVGLATGMYYTPAGGDIMFVEASMRELEQARGDRAKEGLGLGSVSLILTGQLGDVMKESARAALTYATSNAVRLGIPADRLGPMEVHIHVPAGAIPKDGPSAGVTMATALVSAMSGRPVRRDVAMTGEITIRGRVLPIGGVKEKVLGAHRSGIKEVILPVENERDVDEIPEEVRRALVFRFVSTLDEITEIALLPATRMPNRPYGAILSAAGEPIVVPRRDLGASVEPGAVSAT